MSLPKLSLSLQTASQWGREKSKQSESPDCSQFPLFVLDHTWWTYASYLHILAGIFNVYVQLKIKFLCPLTLLIHWLWIIRVRRQKKFGIKLGNYYFYLNLIFNYNIYICCQARCSSDRKWVQCWDTMLHSWLAVFSKKFILLYSNCHIVAVSHLALMSNMFKNRLQEISKGFSSNCAAMHAAVYEFFRTMPSLVITPQHLAWFSQFAKKNFHYRKKYLPSFWHRCSIISSYRAK